MASDKNLWLGILQDAATDLNAIIKTRGTTMIGTYVIVRSSPSGCWAGTLASLNGDTVELTNARRLWRWWAAKGVSLSGIAAHGLHPGKTKECRIAAPVSRALILQVCEVLETTDEARVSIEAAEAIAA